MIMMQRNIVYLNRKGWLVWLALLIFISWEVEVNVCWGTEVPHYQIAVEYHPQERRLHGNLRLTVPDGVYPDDHLLFALPMNRFIAPDPRGPEKILKTPIFALDEFRQLEDNPFFPEGFSPGQTIIHAITDSNGRPLRYRIKANKNIPEGFNSEQGLLQIDTNRPLPQSTILIEFETILPVRFREGLVETELMTVKWHPVLLNFRNYTWETNLMTPSLGTYAVTWKSSQKGTLITSSGHHQVSINQSVELPSLERSLKYFPLVFSPNYQKIHTDSSSFVSSFYLQNDHWSRAKVLQTWADKFITFLRDRYQLPLPWKKIFVVEIQGDNEQISVVNNVVLVSTPHYKRAGIMERRIMGFFSRGLGELWFGETVLHHLDTQLWLSRGLTAFFSLRFYKESYGPDSGIFDFIDWLNPRYREHFYEYMAREIPKELQFPIISSIHDNGNGTEIPILMRIMTYKTALVISMLEYVMGPKTFQKGLLQFYNNYRYQMITDQHFQQSMQRYSEEKLDWFFKQWFHTTKEMDYAIGPYDFQQLPNGLYETHLTVLRQDKAIMPVEVQILTENGEILWKRIQGRKRRETLTFISDSPPSKISLDPDEHLLELDRTNNHSFTFHRIRFMFDWKKQREVMTLWKLRADSNAIDGKQVWGELNNDINRFYSVYVSPGYGLKNERFLYRIGITRKKFWDDNLKLNFSLSEFKGIMTQGIALKYLSPRRKEKLSYTVSTGLEREILYTEQEPLDPDIEESGNTSNIIFKHSGHLGFNNIYFPSWSLDLEQSLRILGADFSYTLLKSKITHLFSMGFRQRLRWSWIYMTTFGKSPLQKKYQLGSPKVLRGYPQKTSLRDDQMLVMRLDFEFPLISKTRWGNLSLLGMQGILFCDTGKIWSENESFYQTPQRQDVGFGVLWNVDALALLQTPLRIDIAYPFNDTEFTKPRIILGGVWSFTN